MVRIVATGAELQIMQLDAADPLRNLLNGREKMDEFSYYHNMAAVLLEDARDSLKTLGRGIARYIAEKSLGISVDHFFNFFRASVVGRDALKGIRCFYNCVPCSKLLFDSS